MEPGPNSRTIMPQWNSTKSSIQTWKIHFWRSSMSLMRSTIWSTFYTYLQEFSLSVFLSTEELCISPLIINTDSSNQLMAPQSVSSTKLEYSTIGVLSDQREGKAAKSVLKVFWKTWNTTIILPMLTKSLASMLRFLGDLIAKISFPTMTCTV